MSEMVLNATPVRTARNFKINDIRLNDINFRKDYREFLGLNVKRIGCLFYKEKSK